MDRESPAGKALGEPLEIMQFARSRLDEEIAHKQPNKQLRNPFLPVKQTKHCFNVLSDLHYRYYLSAPPVLSMKAHIRCFG